jgi:hypothetical protein
MSKKVTTKASPQVRVSPAMIDGKRKNVVQIFIPETDGQPERIVDQLAISGSNLWLKVRCRRALKKMIRRSELVGQFIAELDGSK